MPIDFDKECFFIAPIGPDDSDIRRRSDGVRDFIVREAAEANELETRRADDVDEPGQITSQIVEHCLKAKMVVADLTEGNANVYYELSVRHGKQLPAVLIAEHGTPLPFDVGQARVIFFDPTDLSSAGSAREAVRQQIGAALESEGPFENPISSGMRLAALEAGDPSQRALASVMERLDRMAAMTNEVNKRLQAIEQTVRVNKPSSQRSVSVDFDSLQPDLVKLPSPESLQWASMSPEARQQILDSMERGIRKWKSQQDPPREPDDPEA
jgi:hypothetical protein